MKVEQIYITWLNHLGGFEYFLFIGTKEYETEILESNQTKINIMGNWPNSYGLTADTIDKQTYRRSKKAVVVKSQHLTLNQLDALSGIKTSPLVQVVYSRTDRITVLVDTDSFRRYSEDDKVFTMQFRITFTDDIPSQRL